MTCPHCAHVCLFVRLLTATRLGRFFCAQSCRVNQKQQADARRLQEVEAERATERAQHVAEQLETAHNVQRLKEQHAAQKKAAKHKLKLKELRRRNQQGS